MQPKEKGITLGILSIALISMAIILILSLMKVYLSNQIYHESRKVNIIEAEVAALREENSILQMNVEQLKYKNQVTDTIFSMEENKKITEVKESKMNEEKINPKKKINTKALWEGTNSD